MKIMAVGATCANTAASLTTTACTLVAGERA
jgi:hypothetical protein